MEATKKGRGGVAFLYCMCVLFLFDLQGTHAQLANHVVISELFGGGGNAGAKYKNDYIELYNPTKDPIEMNQWSIQYASASGLFSNHNRTIFSGIIGAHGFFLIQEAAGSNDTTVLPNPDVSDSVAFSASSGKIALVQDSAIISGPADANVVDFVGYGSANIYEGAGPAPTLSNTKCAQRKSRATSTSSSMAFGGVDSLKGNGMDTGNNDSDFVSRTFQYPQNSLSSLEDTTSGDSVSMVITINAGWNMISVPLDVSDFRATTLYPSASSLAFGYDGSYFVKDTLMRTAGYWLRFPIDTIDTLNGFTQGSEMLTVLDGWNLIGTTSFDVPVANISSNPSGIIASSFFGFNGSYTASDTLYPAKAYWIKINGGGTISLISNSTPSDLSQRMVSDSHLHSVTFVDAEGNKQLLFFGRREREQANVRSSEVPPLPPAGTFDVRFTSNRNVEVDGHQLGILLQAHAYPVTMRWNIEGEQKEHYRMNIGTNDVIDMSSPSGSISITDSSVHNLELDVVSRKDAPREFSLSSCYPNPFNPSTQCTLSLPADDRVRVEVYDMTGRSVRHLLDGPVFAGTRTLEWDGRDDDGHLVSGGVYVLRFSTPSVVKMQKAVFLK